MAAATVHSTRTRAGTVWRVRWREGRTVLERRFTDRAEARAFAREVSTRLRGDR